ncbi:MAG: MBOAT family protein [Lachnospiraceae bacterium]|nr:MBOAT family protein [Lachnospiraceae bacterium]
MVFSSILFVFMFLPAVLLVHFLVRGVRARNLVLLAASLLFYAWGEPVFVLAMIASILCNYVLALAIGKAGSFQIRKEILILAIAANLALLFVFKYLNFTVKAANDLLQLEIPPTNIALPIGISFFTFQAMSYCVDVYRGDAGVQKNPLELALYISFFPQLIAGPIVRYNTISEQIRGPRRITAETFAYGVRRFLTGFLKKVILANNLSLAAHDQFQILDFSSAGHGAFFYWIGVFAYGLQIFFDFSGYSDMAIGLGAMFGFRFEENFRYPFTAGTVTAFWQNWHISLGRWFRDYVYIPLGGSRVKPSRNIRNLFVVWLFTGIWHGANYTYIAWGLAFFVLLVIEKFVVRVESRGKVMRVLWHVVTQLAILFLWAMFNAVGIKQALHYWMAMLGLYGNGTGFTEPAVIRLFREYGVFMAAGLVFTYPTALRVAARVRENKTISDIADIAVPVLYLAGFLWAVSYLVTGANNPFIYFMF